MKELKLFGPSGNLGYGVGSDENWKKTMKWEPDVIFQQGTSTDPGPSYLGTGKSYADRVGIKHDLGMIIPSAIELDIPFIGSFGGGGSDKGLNWNLDIIDEIARENNLKFRAAVISGEIEKGFIKKKLAKGIKIKRLDTHPGIPEYLTSEMIDESKVIVGQMGPEPILKALDMGVDMVFTGRANDTSLPMAIPLREGFDRGLSLQVAKIVECGGLAILRKDNFLITSLDPKRAKGNIDRVLSHGIFYERRDPHNPEYMPGGHLNISNAHWEKVDDRTTKGSGGVWVEDPYTVKIEGVKSIGYRSICVAGMRDPWLISKVEDGSYMKLSEETARRKIADAGISEENYNLHYRIYGLNGVMGRLEPIKKITSHELGFVVDVIGKTPEISKAVCMLARLQLIHLGYPQRRTTAGNVAFAFSPSDIYVGETYDWNMWHLLPLEGREQNEIFKTRIIDFPRNQGV